ncbi:YTH domain-containing protein ECT2-like isoform X2 [Phragmites australis]|uniref:YTH domain-containing protein ECT2-like isoform X2 n=1 Tax=Phragmites australis TaxID=29695 RepID=UPI002D768E57|nr:YTH domain-containing protein ECT2-like isoform X2 [Phragmites australis]
MDKQEPVVDAEQKIVLAEKPKEQPVPSKDEKTIVPPISVDSNAIDLPSEGQAPAGTSNTDGDHNPHNFYASQAQPFYYQGSGYKNTPHEWDAYPPYMSVEGLEVVYNEDPSLMFHGGYGYDPYAHYSPIATPVPASVSGDGQLYSPQQFSFSAPYYQQSVPPGMPYLSSPTPISQGETMMPIDPTQGAFIADTLSPNSFLFGPRPEWFRSSEGTGSFPSPAASPQPAGGFSGAFGQSNFPMAPGMFQQSPHQEPFYGFGPPTDSYGRGFSHGGVFPQANNYGGSFPSFGLNGRSSISIEKARMRGRDNALICSCNGSLGFLDEQSRGPRATKPKKQPEGGSMDEKPSTGVGRELYNRPDFGTEYTNARFFIIKSYSEDNVHKSIKYGVWASTTNGNKKLDSAYRETKEKEEHCPVFLLFSVNASAQFCGVAEMIGPVDFEKSVDYWQQDKWTGQFPVKWHIVKDVPNNLFRHIILENNDNKPVTNSRDTQEVKLEQGLEMLKIFKNHDDDASILDDFDFYEEREKALQENKARLHQQHRPSSIVVEPKKPLAVPTDLVGHITKSFAQAVRLGEAKTVSPSAEKVSAGNSSIPVKPVEVKDSGLS